jgi:hypothetical protein
MRSITAAAMALMAATLAADPLPADATGLSGKDSKVGSDLMALASDARATSLRSTASGEEVVIDTAASGDPEALAADLRALGARK